MSELVLSRKNHAGSESDERSGCPLIRTHVRERMPALSRLITAATYNYSDETYSTLLLQFSLLRIIQLFSPLLVKRSNKTLTLVFYRIIRGLVVHRVVTVRNVVAEKDSLGQYRYLNCLGIAGCD